MLESEWIFTAREPTIGGQVILLQRRSLASSHVGARIRSRRESSAETCIKILVTESFRRASM